MVKSFGATAVFDYTSQTVASDIKAYTKGQLRHALDCITDQDSAACCYNAIGRAGGNYTSLEACPAQWRPRNAIKYDFVLTIEAFGKDALLGGEYTRVASKEKQDLSAKLFVMVQKLLDKRMLETHPIKVVGRGFDKIIEALETLKRGEVRGSKLVVLLG